MPDVLTLSWADVIKQVDALWERQPVRPVGVFGVPTGGAVVAALLSQRHAVPLLEKPTANCLVVDDLVDTGRTFAPYVVASHNVDALYRKPWSPSAVAQHATEVNDWLAFPWERDEGDPTDAVVRLLQHVGEDPTRDGLIETPRRVTKAWRELTKGYSDDPAAILSKTFDVAYDDMVVVRKLPFTSLCEHHILPFVGHATIAYIPTKRVVGLSKLARLLDCYANRLQVQERMTGQIADAIQEHLNPLGVGVVVSAVHTCMSMRGIKKEGDTVTSALRGVFKSSSEARQELMSLHHGG